MSVTSAPRLPHHSRLSRRGIFASAGIAAAGALSVATLSVPWLGHAISQRVGEGLSGVETVAAMLADRSPGTRTVGELAMLKHKRSVGLHERALPKVRGPYTPPTAYQALSSPPPAFVPPPPVPLFGTMAGGPPEAIPPIGGAPTGDFGPPALSNIPSPGSGGGGAFTPPIVTAVTPGVLVTPAAPVPEPSSWGMMLLGFGLMAAVLRRRVPAGIQPGRG